MDCPCCGYWPLEVEPIEEEYAAHGSASEYPSYRTVGQFLTCPRCGAEGERITWPEAKPTTWKPDRLGPCWGCGKIGCARDPVDAALFACGECEDTKPDEVTS